MVISPIKSQPHQKQEQAKSLISNRTNRNLSCTCFVSKREKLKNKKFPLLQKNKTSQPHNPRQTDTNIIIRHGTTKHLRTFHGDTDERSTGGNSGFNKCGLTRVNQVQFFNQAFVSVDSLSLRNPALLKAANRCAQW